MRGIAQAVVVPVVAPGGRVVQVGISGGGGGAGAGLGRNGGGARWQQCLPDPSLVLVLVLLLLLLLDVRVRLAGSLCDPDKHVLSPFVLRLSFVQPRNAQITISLLV